ncbi:serine hydrolase domain-containing protein [Nitrospirillum sp. BR 11163]|uniref:serine hydrolase domain-containing protein n=1 Tax=Nitrospirillum sp. BR 11163 TaxID=3104323 RepID=UPI002B000AB9|nr:serine hydrolase domain-containing protein [Nitrospirillum sp. BR 11163]MEA1672730.1 serine hydrolase domain-containing protein [Nitrospirillum sp. BR 11163]
MTLAATVAPLLPPVSTVAAQTGSAVPDQPATGPMPRPMTREDLEPFVDGIMSQRLERDSIAGAAIAVVKDGAVLFEKGYGYADVERRTPVRADQTLFGVASISKTFTATAVMQLVEQGKLNLDADVQSYLDFPLRKDFPEPVTLRQLLTHTAGLQENGKDLLEAPETISDLGQFLRSHQLPQIFRPGSRVAYSNFGNSLAGYVVERVSGQPFAAYVADHILKPLGMAHSTFAAPVPADLAPLMSKEYKLSSEPPRPVEYLARRPAGGMYSTADDMARYMIAHLQDGAYGDARILEEATARTMHTIQWRARPDAPGIAVAFYQSAANGRFALAHGGDLSYQHSYLWLVPSERLGVFLIFNSSGTDMVRIRSAVWQSLLDRYLPPAGPLPEPAANAAQDARAVAGAYLTTRRAQTTILTLFSSLGTVDVTAHPDGSISVAGLTRYDGSPRTFWSDGKLMFREHNGEGHTVTFVTGASGRPDVMVVDSIAEYERQGAFNGHVLALLLAGAVAVLLAAALLWPISTLVRWRLKRPLRETMPLPVRRRRLAVNGVILVALVLIALVAIYVQALASLDLTVLSVRFDPAMRVFQVLAALVCLGALFTLWSAVIAWRRREGSILSRTGLSLVTLSLLVMAATIAGQHLLTPSLAY